MAPHCSDQSIGRSVRRLMQNPRGSSWGDVSSSVGGAGPDRLQPEEAVSVPIRAGDRLGDLRKAGSSRGANVPSPPLPGETVTIPPPIPLLTLVVIHLVGINITGTSINPARSIGPALVGFGSNPERVAQLWLFIIAPLIGAGPAGFLFREGALLDQKKEG